MNKAKQLFRSSLTRTLYTILSIAISFFMLPFLVHHLGDKWYGLWTIAAGITGYYYLVDFGLSTAIVRYISQYIATEDNDSANQIINTSFIIYLFLGCIILLLSFAMCLIADAFISDMADLKLMRLIILLTGLNLAIEFPFKAFAGIIDAYIRYDLITYCHFVMLILSTAATVYFIGSGAGVVALALIGLIGSQISNILFYLISRHLFRGLQFSHSKFRKNRVRELFSYSFWSFLIQVSDQIRFGISPIIIGAVLTAQLVTHYFIGARLVGLFMTLVFRATNILLPVFTRYYAEHNYQEMVAKLFFFTKISVIAAVFGGGLIIMLGESFIDRWMGANYLDAYPVLVILVIGVICEIIINPSNNVLYAMALHQSIAVVGIIEGLSNLGLSLLLISHYGIIGVALGAAIPQIISRIFVLPAIVCKSLELPVIKYYRNMATTILFTIGYLFLFYMSVNGVLIKAEYMSLILSVICSLPLYLVSILFISFTKDERTLLRNMLPG
jgi:O-antigen/teichoic acid export membrane protein